MSMVFLHCAIKPPIYPGLPALLAELRARGEPTMLVVAEQMLARQPEAQALFDRVLAIPGDIHDSALLERAVFRRHAEAPIKRIIATGEAGVLRAARLRTALGVPGQSAASALAYRDKVVMKAHVARAGLRVPRYRAVDSPTDVLAFVAEIGFPIVLKPRSGLGSMNTLVLRGAAALDRALAGLRAQAMGLSLELIVEEFIDGQLHHVNGYATGDGALGLCWPGSYLERGNLDVLHGASAGEYLMPLDDPRVPRLNAFAEACLRALPWPEHGFAFHLEVFEEERTGELVFCEVASRHGGGSIAELYAEGFGVRLPEVSLRLQAGAALPAHATTPRQLYGTIFAPLRAGTLRMTATEPPAFPWLMRHELMLKPGESTQGAQDCVEFAASFLVKAEHAHELFARMTEAQRWYDSVASWDAPA